MSPPWETFCFLGRNSPRPLWRPLAFLVRFGEARNISGCPVSQNFGNRWVANPCMWVTPSPPGSIEAWQGRGNTVQVVKRAAWKLAPPKMIQKERIKIGEGSSWWQEREALVGGGIEAPDRLKLEGRGGGCANCFCQSFTRNGSSSEMWKQMWGKPL